MDTKFRGISKSYSDGLGSYHWHLVDINTATFIKIYDYLWEV